ncbi:MAG: nucleotidyltransferase family protein [Verrucomicrobiota bacterium]
MPGNIRKAMVLAAGYGMRLRPLTDKVPKPLVPVAGRPMIDYALDHLRRYGIDEVIINVSHLREQLVAHAARCADLKIRISDEPEPLETGGGLRQALPLLGTDPFFAINSDIVWTENGEPALQRLAATWDESAMDVLLLVQPKSRALGYDRGEDHLFIHETNTHGWNPAQAPYIIAGVGILHPRVFQSAPEGKFSVKRIWTEALNRNRLFCLPHHGRWFQTGTAPDIAIAERELAGRDGVPAVPNR